MSQSEPEAAPRASEFQEPGAGLVEELAGRFSGDETDAPPETVPGAVPQLEYSRFDRGYKSFARWFSYLAGLALAIITIVCFIDVIGSKFFGKAIPSQTELVANLNVVIVFLAVFYVQMDRGNVSIELLQDRFPRPLKLAVRLFGSILGVGVSHFCAYRGWFYLADFWTTHKSASGVWHFPIWPFQAVLVFGFFCLGVAFMFTVARDITDCRLRRGKFAPKTEGRA